MDFLLEFVHIRLPDHLLCQPDRLLHNAGLLVTRRLQLMVQGVPAVPKQVQEGERVHHVGIQQLVAKTGDSAQTAPAVVVFLPLSPAALPDSVCQLRNARIPALAQQLVCAGNAGLHPFDRLPYRGQLVQAHFKQRRVPHPDHFRQIVHQVRVQHSRIAVVVRPV